MSQQARIINIFGNIGSMMYLCLCHEKEVFGHCPGI